MTKLFLTSSVNMVAYDIAKRLDLGKKNKLVFITTPAEPKTGDKTWLKNDRQALVDAGFEVEDYTITGKNLKQMENDLSGYDFIYMSGGDTVYLLKESHKTGFFGLVKDYIEKQGKTYIGTSAGSIIAGPKVPDYLFGDDEKMSEDERKGYGFVNFTVVPHWGTDAFRSKYLDTRLKIAYVPTQVPLLLLTDNQYVFVKGDKLEVVDVTKTS